MLLSNKFWEIAEHFIEVINEETGFPMLIYDDKGYIVIANDKSRIGNFHTGAGKIMQNIVDEYAVTSEEAAQNPLVREGYSYPITIDGKRVAGFGITGKLELAKPLAKIASKMLNSWLQEFKHKQYLEYSEYKYRRIFENSVQGIFQATLSGEFISVNQALAQLYGYSTPQALMSNITDIANQLYADANERQRLISRLMKKEEAVNFITRFRRKDGKIIDVRIYTQLVHDNDGEEPYLEGIVEDITEKMLIEEAIKVSREKYFKAFNSSPVWVVLTEMETGRYIEVNETYLHTMGYDRNEVIGRTSLDVVSWKNPEERKTILNQIREKGNVRNYEVKRLTRSGACLTMLFSASVIEVSGKPCLLAVSLDITARKQAEEDLRISESNLRITLDSIGDAVISTDTKNIITRMNIMAERFTGWPVNEAVGKPLPQVLNIINARTKAPLLNPAERVLSEGKNIGLGQDTILINKDGNEYRIADSGAPIRGDNGKVVGAVLVFRDVTKAYAQTKKIQDSERQLKNLSINIPGVVYEFRATRDHHYQLNFVSEKAVDLLGIDVPADQFFETFYECIPDKEKQGFMDSIAAAVDKAAPWYYEGPLVKKTNGETIWFSGSSSPVADGDDIIFYGVLMDITEHKKWQQALEASERRFKNLFDEAPVIYVITSTHEGEPYIQYVNNMFTEVLGYSRQEVLTTPLKKYYTKDSVNKMLEQGGYQRALKGEFTAEERTFVARNGRLVHTLLHSQPDINGEGNIGTRAMFVDITDRKSAEELNRQLEAALSQSQKMEAIGTLAGGIAHDFNNILSAVIGYAELSLTEEEKGSLLYRNLEQILVAGLRARDLVRQILTFSRQSKHELRPLQLKPLIKEALKLLRSTMPSTIDIIQHIDSGLDNVMADPIQIHQIIMNLCTNAAQAMNERGGRLAVRLSEVDLESQDLHLHPGLKPGNYLKLTVEDTGEGIPADVIDKIYHPYFTTKEKGEGTGLGLSVVHGIVKSYGGTINAHSDAGRGATFNVYIPAIERKVLTTKRHHTELPMGNEHILFVDDEPTLVELACKTLELLGYKVTPCNGSLNALEIFSKAPDDIDLVISDVTMPDMTGDKLAARLLKIRPGLPIILCTGFSKTMMNKRESELGVKRIVTKPMVVHNMAHLIRSVLDEAGHTGRNGPTDMQYLG